jgi:hypothetical protein
MDYVIYRNLAFLQNNIPTTVILLLHLIFSKFSFLQSSFYHCMIIIAYQFIICHCDPNDQNLYHRSAI